MAHSQNHNQNRLFNFSSLEYIGASLNIQIRMWIGVVHSTVHNAIDTLIKTIRLIWRWNKLSNGVFFYEYDVQNETVWIVQLCFASK